ncbi:hypothetical protein VPH35_025679 [Triticum aestivum]
MDRRLETCGARFRREGGNIGVFVQNIRHGCANYPHLPLEPNSTTLTRARRRRPRARSTVLPPASRSTPSSSRRLGARTTPPPSSTPSSTSPCSLPLPPELHILRSSRRPLDAHRTAILAPPPRHPAVVLANPRSCCCRGSISGLPLLSHLLLPGLHLQVLAAAGSAATGAPSAGSRCCWTCCYRGSIPFELRPSRSQLAPCLRQGKEMVQKELQQA